MVVSGMERTTDTADLEAMLLYSVIVAGKNAEFANNVTRRWLRRYRGCDESPFDTIRRLDEDGELEASFRDVRSGNYSKVTSAAREMAAASLDLSVCTPQELEQIKGVGPKTSRFFIIWTRPEEEYAALDVHILRWLRNLGYDAPKSTPQSTKRYSELEEIFIREAHDRGKTPRELDEEIWKAASNNVNRVERQQDDPMNKGKG